MLTELAGLLESARQASARAVNVVITTTYWQIGRRIVEWEQGGAERARYGDRLLSTLSADLTRRFGRGFSKRNLEQMRLFYLYWPIAQTASAQSDSAAQLQIGSPSTPTIRRKTSGKSVTARKCQTPSDELTAADVASVSRTPVPVFPLPWSHYVRLLSVKNAQGCRFYETEALRGGWSVKQLDRQISSQFYERTLLSRHKAAMLTKGQKPRPEDNTTPQEQIKDPFVLEFLGLKDEYSETDLEEALIRHLEMFLLELGGDFAFVGRQRRLRIGNQWYRIDLLFFHRKLRCLVIIDLKLGALTHADAGQMHMYCNYAAEHWINDGENPPVGLILCAEKDVAVAHYALENLPNKVLAAEYRMQLPDETTLAAEVENTQKMFQSQAAAHRKATRR